MSELLDRIEALRIPVPPRDGPSDWKDWYHFVLLDLHRGTRVLANVALGGGGAKREIQTTVLVHGRFGTSPDPATFGAAATQPWPEGSVSQSPLAVTAEGVDLRRNESGFELTLAPPGTSVSVRLSARPEAAPLLVTEGAPFGSGFIGWGLVPGLAATGSLRICGEVHAIDDGWFCYQDHNYGRFRWGEDIGWEWLTAHGRSAGGETVTLVLDIRTNRAHDRQGLRYLFICVDGRLRKLFLGPALHVRWVWSKEASLPVRLPGAMATLFADRATRIPVALEVDAADERDRIAVRVGFDAFVELIVPDNEQRQYTRIGEANGPMRLDLKWQDLDLAATGYAYGEYTH